MRKGLFVVLLFFFLLFLPSVKDQSHAAVCSSSSGQVKIDVHGDEFSTIQAAYDYASGPAPPPNGLGLSSFVLLLSGNFEEDVLLNGGAVILDGGYDSSFFSKTSPTTLNGKITISTGSLTVTAGADNPKIISPLPECAFDNDGDGFTSIGSCAGRAEDCNDNNASINPGAVDIPYDGIDQDCSGLDLLFAEDNLPNEENCGWCHNILPTEWDDVHANVPAPDGSCVACHSAKVSNMLSGHYGQTVRTDGNNMTAGETIVCNSCHDQSGGEHIFGNGTVMAKVFAAWASDNLSCDSCHETRATDHATVEAHENRLIDSSCAECHTSDTSNLGQPGTGTLVSQADVDILHRSDCVLCHNYSGTLIDAGLVQQTIEDGINGAQTSCTACHSEHHSEETNQVFYDPTVDTSQPTPQGCANCHYDYDIVNGTSLGLSTWETILVEHDLDGIKDGSSNTCANCHNYDGSSSAPLGDVQNAIATGCATCASCHTDKVPDVAHGAPNSGKHPEHLDMLNVGCSTCHLNPPYFKSGTDSNGDGLYDLSETDVCYSCHQDGNGNPATDGFKDGWHDPDFVLACGSCHALAPPTGSHVTHYNGVDTSLVYGDLRITQDFAGGQVSSVNMIGCGNCHPLDLPYHGNGTWGDVELANTAAPVDSLKSLSPSGSYDQATGTCSNVYCHSVNSWTTDGPVPEPWPEASGWDQAIDPLPRPLPDNIVTQRAYKDVAWGGILTCSGCHENPPQTSAVDNNGEASNDGGAGDSHYWVDSYGYENLHIYNMGSFPPIGCRTCHYETVQEYDETYGIGWDIDPVTNRRIYNDVPIYDKAKHVNGSVDVSFDTVNNFTYTSTWSGQSTPIDLSLSSFDQPNRTCSNVGCHILETEVTWGLPYRWENSTECNRCHGY